MIDFRATTRYFGGASRVVLPRALFCSYVVGTVCRVFWRLADVDVNATDRLKSFKNRFLGFKVFGNVPTVFAGSGVHEHSPDMVASARR